MSRVLVTSHEPLAARLAGPAMRALETARALASSHSVVLAVPNAPPAGDWGVPLAEYRLGSLAGLAAGFDVVVVSGLTYNFAAGLGQAGPAVVIDTFIPFVLEELQARSSDSAEAQAAHHTSLLGAMRQQLAEGDFFLCASEKQRDFWLGGLAQLGRITPEEYRRDETLRRLIDVMPFGVPAEPAPVAGGMLRGPGRPFGDNDLVLYWGGGVYDWFDPETLIRAVARLGDVGGRPVRLFFAGVRHPNPDVAEMGVLGRCRRLVADLGLERSVIFNDWVPYAERGRWLRDADIGVSLHIDHLETRFSFRTRLMDYVWAGLPMVLSGGDTLGDELAAAGVAQQVADRDVDGAAAAIRAMAEASVREVAGPAFEVLRTRFAWPAVVEPLRRFAEAPQRSPSRRRGVAGVPGSPAQRAWGRMRRAELGGLVSDTRAWVAWRRSVRRG